MKKILYCLMMIFLVSCGQKSENIPTSPEEGQTSVDELGIKITIPEEYMVIWKQDEEILELVDKEYSENRMVVKRMEPFYVEFFEPNADTEYWFYAGKPRPDYTSHTKGSYTVHQEGENLWFDYYASSGDIAIEGRQWNIKQDGALLAVVAEGRQSQPGSLRKLENIYQSMKFSFPKSQVADFRKKLSQTPQNIGSFLELARTMEEKYGQASTRDWDMMVRDLADFGQKVLEESDITSWQDGLKDFGVYQKNGKMYFQPLSFYQRYSPRLTVKFDKLTKEALEIIGDRNLADVEDLSSAEEWEAYIFPYGKLEEFVEGKPNLSGYTKFLLEDMIRKAHLRFALGIRDPLEARVAYSRYMIEFPKGKYFLPMSKVFEIPADDPFYNTHRMEVYKESVENDLYQEELMME